ncbi:hypothetical protein JTB14_026467 [Gonioctena quinquepunctata]|nr:hypothetical protein JTB14_026467 [Gonioctena quinquepunctata]
MTFDMSLALESVSNLKQYVQEEFKIAADKQVLLISGGECLDPNKRVCSYSAGTDTNPIFLFSKSIIESPTPPLPSTDYGLETDVDLKVKEHCDMPVTFSTVSKRAQLAQQLLELARKQLSICESLVHDQHLQQQGWSAVVANLEDITLEFHKRSEIFEKSFDDYMVERDSYLSFLTHFSNDLQILQRIPVLTALLETQEETDRSNTSDGNQSTSLETDTSKEITLYEWISASDNKSTMDQLYDHCSRGLEQFDGQVFKSLTNEIEDMLKCADNPQMKEVKGLGERLSGLETLMREAKKFVKQQQELAQSFSNNQIRASNTKDASVLPDLCLSHKKQLQMMANNHQQLCDIRRRCSKAKEELSVNLYHRLRWVMYIEDRILEIDQKLVIYHENLKRLRRHLEILQQIHLAPATYLCAVAEVVRRREFSQTFLMWATELACHLLTIHNEEVTRRKEFQLQFEGHFLNSLFPGMEDVPPSFATQAPSMFDSCLPRITEEDVERLKKELPDLADNLNVPDVSAITNFFFIKSLVKKDEDERKNDDMKAVEDKLVQAVSDVELASDLDRNLLKGTGLPHLKDLDRGCESETDTEEFEKVGQSPLELHFDKTIPSPRPRMQDASTLTEENLQISRSEHDKLKSLLLKLHLLAKEATHQLRTEMGDLRIQMLSNRNEVSQQCESLGSSWENLIVERDTKEKEVLESIRKSHEVALDTMKRKEVERNRRIEELLCEKLTLESEVSKSCQDLTELRENVDKNAEEHARTIKELQRQIEDKELEKERNIKELTDRLNRDHKAEIENIRSRFKLMTMERSPSETNLEKSGEFSSMPNHSTLLLQMTENFELDKEKAVNEALVMEREKWEKLLAVRVQDMETRFEEEKEALLQDVAGKISEEKDAQIDVLREREKNLNLECIKYKNTIQQLAESGTESNDSELLRKINVLQKEKESLEEELEKMQAGKVVDLATSVAVCEGKVDVMTSPIRQKDSIARSEIPTRSGRVSIDTCKTGDLVVILWDPAHGNFRILQENKHMYFLHSDYLEGLGLEITDGEPNKLHVLGEVVDKEYCFARKSENRYKVPKRTKFFRVKVRTSPNLTTSKDITQSLYHPKTTVVDASRMTQSQLVVTEISENVLDDKPYPASPPTSPTRLPPMILEGDEPDNAVEDTTLVGNEGFGHVGDYTLQSKEKIFAEDSGIVDNIEQVTAALNETVTLDNRNESESSDRDVECDEQHTYISSTWLETMISRVFNKSIQNSE